jgi:hypothetical protein
MPPITTQPKPKRDDPKQSQAFAEITKALGSNQSIQYF